MGGLGLGPTIDPSCRWTSFWGVKGGVGCSVLTSLLVRRAAKERPSRIALVDPYPLGHSMLPSFLSIRSNLRALDQLLPYQGRLSAALIDSFFPSSPEGVSLVPLVSSAETSLTAKQAIALLKGLSPFFKELWFDLSGAVPELVPEILEGSQRVFLVSALEPSSLTAIKLTEKRLLPFHMNLNELGILFNQSHASQTVPKDIENWAPPFQFAGAVPFLGDNLTFLISDALSLPAAVDKALSTLTPKLLDGNNFIRKLNSPTTDHPSGESGMDVTLDQVQRLHQKLLAELRKTGSMQEKETKDLDRAVLEPQARDLLNRLLQEEPGLERAQRSTLLSRTLDLAFGLGPLEPFLKDEEVTEIMVNGPQQVFIEKKGMLEHTQTRFADEQQLRTIIERVLAPIGRRIDESQPYVDGRLSDGSRVNAVIPPLSLNGPLLTIRKFSKKKLGVEDLIRSGSLTRDATDLLGALVRARKNLIVSGGTGSGKTTLLNILSNHIPPTERIVTIEDSAELQLAQEHVVRLESRPANLEGKGRISIRDLVINTLRMRPDRIIVGECRGGEALDMLQAMNTGHDGSMTTVHANSPRDALARIETMCLFSGLELPLKAIREQVARAVHVVVQQSRLPGGKRSVTQISQVQGMEGDVIVLQDIFKWEGDQLVRTPFPPTFLADLNAVGYQWPGAKT